MFDPFETVNPLGHRARGRPRGATPKTVYRRLLANAVERLLKKAEQGDELSQQACEELAVLDPKFFNRVKSQRPSGESTHAKPRKPRKSAKRVRQQLPSTESHRRTRRRLPREDRS